MGKANRTYLEHLNNASVEDDFYLFARRPSLLLIKIIFYTPMMSIT